MYKHIAMVIALDIEKYLRFDPVLLLDISNVRISSLYYHIDWAQRPSKCNHTVPRIQSCPTVLNAF